MGLFSFFFLFPFLFFSSTHSKVFAQDSVPQIKKEWQSSSHFKRNKKMGVGLGILGVHGLFGGSIELNFNSRNSLELGFGKAPQYQSFHTHLKRSISGKQFSPYLAGGYSLWFSDSENSKNFNSKTYPAFLGEKFLTEKEKSTGKFQKHLLYSTLGIQYFQIKEPLVGLSAYIEFDLLISLNAFEATPVGGLGLKYYF